jgi:HAD superfamily hydrolase (TIGR01509 family)
MLKKYASWRRLTVLCGVLVAGTVCWAPPYSDQDKEDVSWAKAMGAEAVIWDFDGTLINGEKAWRAGTTQFLEEFGVTGYTPEKHKISFGISMTTWAEKMWDYYGLADKKHCVKDQVMTWNEFLNEVITNTSHRFLDLFEVVPGAIEFIKLLKENGIKIAIASNSDMNHLNLICNQFGLFELFGEHIYSVDELKLSVKPDPAVFLYAADKLGVRPDKCVVAEDSKYGFRAAQLAKMRCIGIKQPWNTRMGLEVNEMIDDFWAAPKALYSVIDNDPVEPVLENKRVSPVLAVVC